MRANINIIFIVGLCLTALYMYNIDRYLQRSGMAQHGIVDLEFACKSDGATILKTMATNVDYPELLKEVKHSLYADFVFIFFYVGLFWRLCYARMQNEKWKPLNGLLRLGIFLGVIAGLLDVIEDCILLHNVHYYLLGEYISSYYFTVPKFILCGVVALIWLVSVVKTFIIKLFKLNISIA